MRWIRKRPPMATVRLHVEHDLAAGLVIGLQPAQAHYLTHVMRMARGDSLSLFNGRDGEWQGLIEATGRGWCSVAVGARQREQVSEPDLWLVFAPVKRARIDFIATKATELGVARLLPVFTRHTAVERVNVERLRANAVEAAEQCGRLTVPDVAEPATLEELIGGWMASRRLLVCDESGAAPPIFEALSAIKGSDAATGGWAVMTGPEGGFAPEELDLLRNSPIVTTVALGPRILRADTAAIAALACWQALLGDWRQAGRLSGQVKGL